MRDNVENELGQMVGWPVDVQAAPTPSPEPMEGHWCTLVRLDSQAHAPELFDAYTEATDDRDWTYLPYGPFDSLDGFAEFADGYEGQADPFFYTVIDSATGLCSGLASYLRVNPPGATIEVGHIHFSRRLQRTPAATEAMYLMMRWAFTNGYRRYEWKCDALNEPSRAAAARLGFTYEGTWKQATHYKGRNRDTAWFGITDGEWPALRDRFERWLDPANFDDDGNQRSSL